MSVHSEAQAPPAELAAVWVHKAAKGSDQWVGQCSLKQLEMYRLRKRLQHLTGLVKLIYLSLSFFEEPCWRPRCRTCEVIYGWQLPQIPFWASNGAEIICLVYFGGVFWLRELSLGEGNQRSRWHRFREVLVTFALLDCIVAFFIPGGIVPGIFRLNRLLRPLIFIAVSKFVRDTVNRLWRSFLHFWDILAALGVAVLFFVWFAIVMFSRSEEGREHFHDWPEALASLWVLFTTANFPDVMMPSYADTRASFFFFFVYLLVCLYLLQNVLLAAIYDAYKDQLKQRLCKSMELKKTSIEKAFEVLQEDGPNGGIITVDRWVDFYTAYGKMFLHFMFEEDYVYVRQQAHRTFAALDKNGDGYIEQEEFCMVVEALSNPKIYIPMRPAPSMARSSLGKEFVQLFMRGVRLGGSRYSWRAVLDVVVLIEVLLALGQTIVFVSPGGGGKFRDLPLRPPSMWFKLLMTTTIFFAVQIVLQCVVIGPARYWNRLPYRHRFDVVSVSALLLLQLSAIFRHRAPDWLVRTVLVIHIARAICLMQHIAAFRYLTVLLARLLPVYYRLGLLLLMVFYIFTSIGEQLFGGLMIPESLEGSGYASAGYWALNFDDFPSGLVTLFSLMVINNWFVLAAGFMQVTTIYHSIFFVLFFVIINLVVLNILIALIIDTSAVVRKEIEELEVETEAEGRGEILTEGREALLQRLLLSEGERSPAMNVIRRAAMDKQGPAFFDDLTSDETSKSERSSDSDLDA